MIEALIRAYAETEEYYSYLKEKRQGVTYLKSRRPDQIVISKGKPGDPTAKIAISIVELEERIKMVEKDMREKEKQMQNGLKEIGDPVLQKIAYYHFYKEYSFGQTARFLGMKVSAVKMRWKRFHDREVLGMRPAGDP